MCSQQQLTIERQNFPVSNQQGIWLCSLRQTLPSINHFVHCCIENGTKPDTFLLKVESSTLLQYEVRDSNYRRKARLTAHTHTHKQPSQIYFFFSTVLPPSGKVLPSLSIYPKLSELEPPCATLNHSTTNPVPRSPQVSSRDFSILHRDLARANVSSLQETALLLHMQQSGAFPESFHSAHPLLTLSHYISAEERSQPSCGLQL